MPRFVLAAMVLLSLLFISPVGADLILKNSDGSVVSSLQWKEQQRREALVPKTLLDFGPEGLGVVAAAAAAVAPPGGVAYESMLMSDIDAMVGGTFSIPYQLSVADDVTVAFGDLNFVFDNTVFTLLSVSGENGFSTLVAGNELLAFDGLFDGRQGATNLPFATATFEVNPSAAPGDYAIDLSSVVDPTDGWVDLLGNTVPSNSSAVQGVRVLSAIPEPSSFLVLGLIFSVWGTGRFVKKWIPFWA
ncbi:hypothetical protein BVY02_00720 [bacterium J17]|nr:hypothetical protein BVY02_00720 [bacterium J17]